MPDSVMEKGNAYGAKKKREVYGHDLEFLDQNKKKFEWDEEADLNNMMAQQRFHPNIPAEFPGVPLESDYHLHIPAEEEANVDKNDVSKAAAVNAKIPEGDLQYIPRTSCNYSMQDLDEVDSDSDDEKDHDNYHSNVFTG